MRTEEIIGLPIILTLLLVILKLLTFLLWPWWVISLPLSISISYVFIKLCLFVVRVCRKCFSTEKGE